MAGDINGRTSPLAWRRSAKTIWIPPEVGALSLVPPSSDPLSASSSHEHDRHVAAQRRLQRDRSEEQMVHRAHATTPHHDQV